MSFLEGVLPQDPSERVRQALTRDLELRRSDERTLTRFSGYAYRGGADLVLQHGRFYPGRRLPEQYEHLRGRPSECFTNALLAANADPSLRYCEGFYTTGFGAPRAHGWCIAPDGGVVEVTMPTGEELARAVSKIGMPFVAPERWGYYGVILDARLARAQLENGGLPLLDRSPAEMSEQARDPGLAHLDFSEPHDFPVLKVPYDPARTELPPCRTTPSPSN